jgi:hypothetical protein
MKKDLVRHALAGPFIFRISMTTTENKTGCSTFTKAFVEISFGTGYADSMPATITDRIRTLFD